MKFFSFFIVLFSICPIGIFYPFLIKYKPLLMMLGITWFLYYGQMSCSPHWSKVRLKQNRYIIGIFFIYLLSDAQYFWFQHTVTVAISWSIKIIVYFLMINIIANTQNIKIYLWAIVFGVILLIYLGWDIYLYHPELMPHKGRLQSVGHYNQPNSFALLLTLSFPLVFALQEVEKNFFKKIFLLTLLVMILVSCVYTKSRGGTVGISVVSVLCVMFSKKMFKSNVVKLAVISGLIGAISVFAVAFIMTRSDVASFAGANEASSGDRLIAWIAAVKMFVRHPLLGVGWRKFEEFVTDYGLNHHMPAHNTIFSVMAELGIFGIWFYLAILYNVFVQTKEMLNFFKNRKEFLEICIIGYGIAISLVGFMVNTMFSVKDHDPMYWLLLTFATGHYGIYLKIKEKISLEEAA